MDYSFAHWPEEWKRYYLERLNGNSYQQNLLERSLADGLAFELDLYTGCTLAAMREWKLNQANALDVKLEDVMADFDGTMRRIFGHFGFTADQSQAALDVARSEDVSRMDHAAIAERPQIYSRTISKWRDVLTADQIAHFEERHGDLIRELGYRPAAAMPSAAESNDSGARVIDAASPLAVGDDGVKLIRVQPANRSDERRNTTVDAKTTKDAVILLSSDGTCNQPAASSQSTFTIDVTSGSSRVRLESHFATLRSIGSGPWAAPAVGACG